MLFDLKEPKVWDILYFHTLEQAATLKRPLNVIYFHLFTYKVAVLVFKHEDLLAQIVWLKSKHVHD
jgi:hypothetical protein